MAVIAVAAAGSLVGGAIGGTFLGVTAASWGWMIGSAVGSMLFSGGGGGFDYEGPRLNDSTFSGQVEGSDLPILWGGDRLSGKPIWVKPVREKKTVTSSGGGKGGGGSESTQTTYTYFQTFAVSFGEVPADNPRRIWLNQELVYDVSGAGTLSDIDISFTYYPFGNQSIDSLIEQDVGEGNCPSYKGHTVIVFDDLNLSERFSNRIPVVECEFQTTSTSVVSTEETFLGTWQDIGGDTGPIWSGGTQEFCYHPTDRKVAWCPAGSSNYVSSPLIFLDLESKTQIYLGNYGWHEVWYLRFVPATQDADFPQPQFSQNQVYFSQRDTTNNNADIRVFDWPSGKLLRQHVVNGYSGGASLSAPSQNRIWVGQRNLGTRVDTMPTFGTGTLGLSQDALSLGTGPLSVLANYSGDIVETFTPINFLDDKFGTILNHPTNSYKLQYFQILDITASLITSDIVEDSPDFKREVLDLNGTTDLIADSEVGFCDEENKLLWWKVYTASGGDYDFVIAVNIDTGVIEKWFSLGVDGFIPAYTEQWSYDHRTRSLWSVCNPSNVKSAIKIDLDGPKATIYNSLSLPGSTNQAANYAPFPPRNTLICLDDASSTYDANTGSIWEIYLTEIQRTSVTIASIIADIMERSGIDPTEYDVSGLGSEEVAGFVHATRHSGRSDIELLLSTANADGYHGDNKIEYKIRGGSVAATISADEINCVELSGPIQKEEQTTVNIPMELEIPRQFEIKYRSADNNYTIAIAQSYTAVSRSYGKKTIEISVALYDQDATDLAAELHQQIIESIVYSFKLPVKYFNLEPTDVIEIPIDGINHRVRLTKITRGTNWIMNCEAVLDAAENYISNTSAAGSEEFLSNISLGVNTYLLIFDSPLLRDIDKDHPGPYLTAYSYSSNFTPSSIYYSFDNVNYNLVSAITEQPDVGYVESSSNISGAAWEDWDDNNTITITFYNSDVTLSSSTKAAIEADPTINSIAYGKNNRWEYINFETATQLRANPKIYQISGLLRGRRGTNNFIDTHDSWDLVVVLTSNGSIVRHVLLNSQYEQTIYYKIVPKGTYLSEAVEEEHVILGYPLKPYSPIQLSATEDAGDYNLTWTRRTRKGGSLGGDSGVIDNVGGSLSEDSESYDIDIKTIGDILLNSFQSSTTALIYTDAQQTTDGADSYGKLKYCVYQNSAVVGRGWEECSIIDKGWGTLLNEFIELPEIDMLLGLDDVTASGSAFDYISGNSYGTYTNVNASTIFGDGRGTMQNPGAAAGDGLNLDRTIRDLTTGKTQAHIAFAYIFDQKTSTPNTGYILECTQGAASYRFQIRHRGTSISVFHAPESGSVGTGISMSLTGESPSGYRSRFQIISIWFNLVGEYATRSFNFGIQTNSVAYNTGHSTYASTYQTQTNNAAYDDMIGNDMDNTQNEAPSNISIGVVGISTSASFSHSNLATIGNNFFTAMRTAIKNYDPDNLLAFHPVDNDVTTYTGLLTNSEFGPDLKVLLVSGSQHGLCLFTRRSVSISGFPDLCAFGFENIPSTWKVQDISYHWAFTTDNWANFNNGHYLFSVEPKGWDGAVKKGIHLFYDTTNGLTLRIGTGTGTWTDYSEGTTRSFTAFRTYHIAITCSATNGFKVYVDNVVVITSSGATHTIDWTDAASGVPDTCNMHWHLTNNGATFYSTTSPSSSAYSYLQSILIWSKELSLTDIETLTEPMFGEI